ncbi:hypothetical protein H5410_001116 [Solanum commersonii]|uniref:Uncharacterized protein n=1 Tax=Solanum commersonii TaxID=4109 RepID=A0A9J6AZ82_SOLCO|nr:hypothetical protein H5410_001116 [Solanum commersonii]
MFELKDRSQQICPRFEQDDEESPRGEFHEAIMFILTLGQYETLRAKCCPICLIWCLGGPIRILSLSNPL